MNYLWYTVLILTICAIVEGSDDNMTAGNATATTSSASPSPPTPNGRSFFLFSAIIRRFRERWFGYPSAASTPLFAGPSYPVHGYYNCPIMGCTTTIDHYRPVPYETPPYYQYDAVPSSYYPTQQQQTSSSAQQQSNVVIYHTGNDQAAIYGQNPPAIPPPSLMRPPPYGYGPIYPPSNGPSYIPTAPIIPIPCGPPPYHCPGGR